MGTKPAGLSNEAIQEYAELVGEHYKVYSEEGRADVSDLLAKLGGVCDYARNPLSLSRPLAAVAQGAKSADFNQVIPV